MVQAEKQLNNLMRLLVAGVVLAALVVTILVAAYLHRRWTQAIKLAETQVEVDVQGLEKSIGNVLRKIDFVLQVVADERVRLRSMPGGDQELITYIERQLDRMPELDSLRVSDHNCTVVLGKGNAPTKPVNLADRDYFIYLRDHPTAGMVLSKPLIGKISGKWVVTCARRVKLPGNRFGGVVYGVITVQQFYDLLATASYGRNSVAALRDIDLNIITRYSKDGPEIDSKTTNTVRNDDRWQHLLASGKTEEGLYRAVSPIDGVSRIYSYRLLQPYQLYVHAGLALDDYLHTWRRELYLLSGVLAVFCAGAMALVILLHRQGRHKLLEQVVHERTNELVEVSHELALNEVRLQALLDISQYQAKDIQELLDYALEKVIQITQSRIGYIYHYHEDRQEFVLNTWSKEVMPACSVADAQSVYQLDKTGIWGEAVRQRRTILINDFSTPDPLKKGYPEGHVHLSRFLTVPVFDLNQQIVAVVGVANKELPYTDQDTLQLELMMAEVWRIAKRLEMEMKLIHAGHEWQTTFDAICDSIALLDRNQRILRCNRAARELFKRDFPEIIGQHCWKLVHGAEHPIENCPMTKAVQTRKTESQLIQQGNRWLQVTVDPLLDEQGEVSGAVHIVRDDTERVQAEGHLHDALQLAEQFRTALDYVKAFIYIKDLESRYTYANRPCLELFGCTADDLPGSSDSRFFPPETVARIQELDQRVFNGERTVEEVPTIQPDGTIRIYFDLKTPFYADSSQTVVAGLMGIASDITELKQAEVAVREMQAQLLQNEKMASIGQLSAGIAHEINNPMGFINSNLATLDKYVEKFDRYIAELETRVQLRGTDEDEQALSALRGTLKLDYVQRDIHLLLQESLEGTERVMKIVQDLRTFARSDKALWGRADINQCLESTINIIWNQIKYVAELTKDYTELPKVNCNIQQINQVFMNLLVNAVHAVEESRQGDELGVIQVRTWTDGKQVYIAVSDSGNGVPDELRSRIFEPFFTTKEVGKGTGLGLSISSEIIKKHGGTMTVENAREKGSIFTVCLPINGNLEDSDGQHTSY
jgi:PAS domain S-box-containing protein